MNFLREVLNFNQTKDVEGYENLQNRINEKNDYLKSVYSCFSELNRNLKEFKRKLITLNSNLSNLVFSPDEKNIHEICKLMYQKIINNSIQDNGLVEEILKNLDEHIKKFNYEIEFYEELKKINKELQDEKDRVNKNKDLYNKSGRDAEIKIKKFVEFNSQYLSNLPIELKDELSEITLNPIKNLNNYKNSVNIVNQLIKKFNDKQNLFFEYLPGLGNEDGALFYRFIKIYLQNLEIGEKYLNLNKKQMNESKVVEENSKLKELIEMNENSKKDERPVELVQYQSDLDFSKCKDKKEFDLIALTIETINKNIDKDIFPNYNYEDELKNYKERKLIEKLLEEKGDIDEKNAQEFLDSLKDTTNHKCLIIVLSKLRSNNRALQTKSLFDLLGKAFNILLENAEKNNLYEIAKNCMILSQTYFILDEKKNKLYLFEMIKINQWLTSPNFWRGFIEYMMKLEFIRIKKLYTFTNFDLEKNTKITPKMKTKLNDIVFTQLLPCISNMIDFQIDKRIILKIADEYTQKYNYLSDKNLDNLISLISKDKEEIEKLRKEYSPSLEQINITHNTNKEIKDNKEENKKDDKEENRENKDNGEQKEQESTENKKE